MKRFAVVLLSVLLVLLPGCTKPVTESGVQSTESGTAESTDASLAEKTDDASAQAQSGHVEKTLSSGVKVDADVYVPESMQKSALAEMRGQGQLIDYEELKSLFCSGKTITEEGEEPWEMVTPGAMEAVGKYVSTQDGDYLQRICGNTFYYMTERDIQDIEDLTIYETGKNLDFASIEETDKTIRDIAEKLNIAVGKGVCYTIDTSSQPHYVFQYEILVNGMPLAMFDGGSYSGDAYVPGTYMTAVVDTDGIRHYDVSYVLEELESGESKKVLTLDEALQAVDDKYNSVIMEGEYFIDDIQMAYTPVQTEETGIVRLIPVWYFQTTHQILVPNRSGTGEVMLPHIEWSAAWGKLLSTFSQTSAAGQNGISIPFARVITARFDPIPAVLRCVVNGSLVATVLGMLMFFVNLNISRTAGGICGTALVLWNMVTYKTWYWFVNISPVSWVNLSRVDYDGSSIYPSLTYILLALLALFAALSAASWVTLRRRNIDVLKSV